MKVEPYLFFEGRCDEALEFYRKTLGAEITTLMRYKDNPDHTAPPHSAEDKVMHANVRIGETTLMASDGLCSGQTAFKGFSLADEAEAERVFGALSEGGQVQMPLGKTFFSPRFGMLVDRFGVSWIILVTAS